MSTKEAIKKNKRCYPFRPNEVVHHIIPEHDSGHRKICWVSKASDRKDQLITFEDDKSNVETA